MLISLFQHVFASIPEDLKVRHKCGQHTMVLCGSRDGYWLFQDSYGLPRGVDDIIKVRKGRLTVSKVRRDKTSASGGKQYVDSKKCKAH